jgi:prepilin-type N-terminal cleavage/methylation domain-containing protein
VRTHRSGGFTLVEMLVVIAIMGILAGLLLPAIQAAREAARRGQCANNLKQIGVALYAYHNVHQVFPVNFGWPYATSPAPGIPDPGNSNSQGRSWLLGLLPYLDEQKLYDRVQFNAPISNPSNTGVASTVLQMYLCPSDRGYKNGIMDDRDLPGSWAVTCYKAVAGSNWALGTFDDLYTEDTMGNRTPDIPLKFPPVPFPSPMSGVPVWAQRAVGRHTNVADGLDYGNGFTCRGGIGAKPTALYDLRDGASNCLAVGEVVPKYCNKTWWYWWDGATATCAIPMNYLPDGIEPVATDWQRNYSFRSVHGGGCQFLLADGHGRFLSENIDLWLYRHLAQINSGEVKVVPQ